MCTKCGSSLPRDGTLVLCNGVGKCKLHKACSGLGESTLKAMSAESKAKWACKECRKIRSTEENENSKIRQQGDVQMESENPDDIKSMLVNLNKNVLILSQQVGKLMNIPNDVEELKKSMNYMSDAHDELLAKIAAQEEKIKNLDKTVSSLTLKLEEKNRESEALKEKVSELEQYSRNRNMEVSNVPDENLETKEDLLRKIEKIATQADIPFQKEDVDILHRLPRMDKDQKKPRNVVIQFKSRTTRNTWIAKKRHGVKVGDVNGSNDPTPIYINEHLTFDMKNLLRKTKESAREKRYEFVWVKDGKIFAKKDPNSKRVVRVRSINDLNKL